MKILLKYYLVLKENNNRKGGASRSIICIYLELVMREMDLIFNYDNVIMMKI